MCQEMCFFRAKFQFIYYSGYTGLPQTKITLCTSLVYLPCKRVEEAGTENVIIFEGFHSLFKMLVISHRPSTKKCFRVPSLERKVIDDHFFWRILCRSDRFFRFYTRIINIHRKEIGLSDKSIENLGNNLYFFLNFCSLNRKWE